MFRTGESQVAEALHEQIADLANLVAELKGENLRRRNSFIMEGLGGSSAPELGLDGLLLSSRELKPRGGSGLDENDTTVPPYSDSPVSGRKSVSTLVTSDVSARKSFARVGT